MTDHKTIAHRWAQDSGASLKGYGMYSAGPCIYSWGDHFVIARWVTAKTGERVVLFNRNSYSSSTGKHQSFTRTALASRIRVFYVPDLKAGVDYSTPANAKPILTAYVENAAALYLRAERARTNGPFFMEQAEKALTDAIAFAAAFGIRWKAPDLTKAAETAKRQADKTRKATAKAAKEAAERGRVLREAQRVQDAEAFGLWSRGARNVRCPQSYRADEQGNAHLRRFTMDDTDELQTSQGAAVPWEHAVKAFRFIRLCVERGEGFKANGRTVRVGHYQVDSIDAQGNMVAGCHRFAWADMKALAEREGVFALTPSAEAVETRDGEAH